LHICSVDVCLHLYLLLLLVPPPLLLLLHVICRQGWLWQELRAAAIIPNRRGQLGPAALPQLLTRHWRPTTQHDPTHSSRQHLRQKLW
jgi:hypothetical protein